MNQAAQCIIALLPSLSVCLRRSLTQPRCGIESVDAGIEKLLPSSTELKPGRGLDGVQELVPHQVLVAELRQLEQVHAGAGGRQPFQVAAPVVDAEGRVKLLCTHSRKLLNTRSSSFDKHIKKWLEWQTQSQRNLSSATLTHTDQKNEM